MSLIGTLAPDFELPDQHGTTWRLSELRGQAVLVVFYPFAFTSVCTGELRELRDRFLPSSPDGVQVLAVSCDSMFAQRVFAEKEGLELPLLSDFWPHGVVASSYGVLDDERGCPRRGSFLVDHKGTVTWSVVNDIPDAREMDAYWRALDELGLRPHAAEG